MEPFRDFYIWFNLIVTKILDIHVSVASTIFFNVTMNINLINYLGKSKPSTLAMLIAKLQKYI